MKVEERVPLASYTTFHIGGPARFFIEAHTEKDITDAIAVAREHKLPLFPLGGGSNLLVPDKGVNGVVLHLASNAISLETDGADTLLLADAGTMWETVVEAVGARGLFGIENLAGIPGTLGGAVVQNIGAYGAELANVFEYADVIDSATGEHKRIMRTEAAFAYRMSLFKKERTYLITRVALRFVPGTLPNTSYPDLARRVAHGEPLVTPPDIARAIRAIRAKKFPHGTSEGTAGSFFKNPIISSELAQSLAERFPGLPVFPHQGGQVKISLAWLLDHGLSLKGYEKGSARLYEAQPLVVVTRTGARAADVDALAREVATRVFEATGIPLEREVETFGENFSSHVIHT